MIRREGVVVVVEVVAAAIVVVVVVAATDGLGAADVGGEEVDEVAATKLEMSMLSVTFVAGS